MTTVTTLEHTDVRDNKLYYLKCINGEKSHLVNVGKKTFDAVNALEQKPTELEFDQQHLGQQELKKQLEQQELNDTSKTTTKNGSNATKKH